MDCYDKIKRLLVGGRIQSIENLMFCLFLTRLILYITTHSKNITLLLTLNDLESSPM